MHFSAKLFAAASAASLAMAAVPAAAQHVNDDPTYGTVELHAGFPDDPYVVDLQSGGSINAASVANGCNGYIAEAPDVRLVYHSGNYPLIVSVLSGSDTTLVINAPDGRWYCDDDGGNNGTNPAIRFTNPASGRYEIWVGTYGSASLAPAQLNISEVYSQ